MSVLEISALLTMVELQRWGVLVPLAPSVDSSLDIVDWSMLSAPGLTQFCVASQLSFPLKVSPLFPIKVF